MKKVPQTDTIFNPSKSEFPISAKLVFIIIDNCKIITKLLSGSGNFSMKKYFPNFLLSVPDQKVCGSICTRHWRNIDK